MHHADAVADRLARRADPDRLAVDADFARVGLVEAVENRHQRRFSGAVLADDAVNDPALDDQIDVVVGVNRAEALVDADQFDGGRGFVGLGGRQSGHRSRTIAGRRALRNSDQPWPRGPFSFGRRWPRSGRMRVWVRKRLLGREASPWRRAVRCEPSSGRVSRGHLPTEGEGITPGTCCRSCSCARRSCRK